MNQKEKERQKAIEDREAERKTLEDAIRKEQERRLKQDAERRMKNEQLKRAIEDEVALQASLLAIS